MVVYRLRIRSDPSRASDRSDYPLSPIRSNPIHRTTAPIRSARTPVRPFRSARSDSPDPTHPIHPLAPIRPIRSTRPDPTDPIRPLQSARSDEALVTCSEMPRKMCRRPSRAGGGPASRDRPRVRAREAATHRDDRRHLVQKMWTWARDRIRVGQGRKRGMHGKALAGFGLQLTLTTSTLTASARRRACSHVDLLVGSRQALGVGRRHRQRRGTGGRGGHRSVGTPGGLVAQGGLVAPLTVCKTPCGETSNPSWRLGGHRFELV